MSTITFKTEDASQTPTPPTGSVQLGVGYTDQTPFYKTDDGVEHTLKGGKGDDGAAATIAVGTVTTVESTDPATVSNSGTSSAAVFDFGIPKGAPGEQGPAGADGHILDVSDLGSITGSITVDLSSAHVFTATLTGDVTLAWSGLPASGTMTDRVLILTQDATGDHAITWPTGTKWPGGLAYTTDAANIETAVGLLVDSAGNTRAFPVEDFS